MEHTDVLTQGQAASVVQMHLEQHLRWGCWLHALAKQRMIAVFLA